MRFSLDDEQGMVVQTIKRFADRDLRAWSADADRAGAPPDKLASTGGELGFFIDAVPADHDGMLEGDYGHTMRALRGFELGRGCAGLAAVLETNVEPALAVGRWGGDAAKRALFGSLAAGGLAVFIHDSRRALEIAVDGDGLRVSGSLGPAPALGAASHVLVASRDVLLLLDASALTREAITPSGWRAARWGTATVDTRVAADFVIARDAAAVKTVLAWANVSLAARAAGVATASMEYAAQYATERVQFGQAIGTFESLIRLRDDAQTGAHAARLVALHAGWALDAGQPDAGDLASRARVLANDVVARATIDAVQIFGGYGFVNDYPVEKLMRDARPFEALHGDERFNRILEAK